MAFDIYSISTKSSAVPAGAYAGIVGGFIAFGKQPNRFDPTKPPQLGFGLCYKIATDSGDVFWCKTYRATWGPKASFFKDCGMLFTAEEITAGQLSPLALLGRPCQLVFTTVRDEAGQEKTVLAVVGSLTKTTSNGETVKRLREGGTFQCDASIGERPPLEILNQLPKWLVEQIEQAGPGQPAVKSHFAPAPQAQPAQSTPEAPDNLDDVNW